MAKNKKNISKATAETLKTNNAIRRNWGAISPVTKVIPNKKKNQKPKHKGKEFDW